MRTEFLVGTSFLRLRTQELSDCFIRSVWLIGSENMTRAWNYHDFRAGNALRNYPAIDRWNELVRFSVNQEGRRENL